MQIARGNTSTGNGRWGIGGNERSTVLDDTLTENFSFGLRLTSQSGYGNNVISGNSGGNANPQASGGLEIDTNVCATNTTCL